MTMHGMIEAENEAPGSSEGLAPLTAEEEAQIAQRLMPLLDLQMRRLTQGDSTSLRVEVAEELMASIRFTLQYGCLRQSMPYQALLGCDLQALFREAQAMLVADLAETQAYYHQLSSRIRVHGSRSLSDTLRGIGYFFSRYDVRLFAHAIPGDIDYPLCIPVPDDWLGIRYIQAYLTRLDREDALLSRLDEGRVCNLLFRVQPLYGELLINLYEPVAQQVIALEALGDGITLLETTRAQGERFYALLAGIPKQGALRLLWQAAQEACLRLGIDAPPAQRYLSATAAALYARVMASPVAVHGALATR